MIGRGLAGLVLVWVLGFVLWVVFLPGPADNRFTDAIVVPTGGAGRVARGLVMLEAGRAKRMLVTGVDRRVREGEFAVAQEASRRTIACCVDLGREAVDTRSNGSETARWIERRGYRSVRLVTTDWHMPRARFELERALDGRATVLPDAVRSAAPLAVLLREYHKYVLRRAAVLVGL